MTDEPMTPPPTPRPGLSTRPTSPRPKKRSGPWVILLAVAVLLVMLFGSALILVLAGGSFAVGAGGGNQQFRETLVEQGTTGKKVVIIPVYGVIINGDMPFSSVANSEQIIKKLRRAGKDDQVASILLDINSPGGEITATDEIYHEIQKLRQQKMPINSCMRSVAASGGYYLAAGTDHIIANRLTMTGSIGVIMGGVNYSKLFEHIGLQSAAYKSGEMKDMGSPSRRPLDVLGKLRLDVEKRRAALGNTTGLQVEAECKLLTQELESLDIEADLVTRERALIQSMVHESFLEFANVVSKGRKLPLDTVTAAPIGDARVVSGREALRLGLVDQLGYLEDAIAHARGGKDHQVVRYDRMPSFVEALTGNATSPSLVEQLVPPEMGIIKKGRLYYLCPGLY
ncbi:hypothetical protein BVY04_03550 [bacterium M21]|nr:hypothetical protein BVY04_03550 [bacterium M21]